MIHPRLRRTEPDLHVLPLKDLREHVESRDCWCQPKVEQEPLWRYAVVTHQAMDGRELIEQHGRQ